MLNVVVQDGREEHREMVGRWKDLVREERVSHGDGHVGEDACGCLRWKGRRVSLSPCGAERGICAVVERAEVERERGEEFGGEIL